MGDRLAALALVEQLLGSEREHLAGFTTPQEVTMLRAGLSALGPRPWLVLRAVATVEALETLKKLLGGETDALAAAPA